MEFEKIIEIISLKQVRKSLPKKYQHLTEFRATGPQTVAQLMKEFIGDEDREVFLVIGLNVKNQVNFVHKSHVGTLNSSLVHPREVFKTAILNNCASIIVGHNHPSGNVTPSPEDIEMTKRLQEVGFIIGIELLDHIIVSETDYFSLRENNYL